MPFDVDLRKSTACERCGLALFPVTISLFGKDYQEWRQIGREDPAGGIELIPHDLETCNAVRWAPPGEQP